MKVKGIAATVLAVLTAALWVPAPPAHAAQWPPLPPDRYAPLWQVTEIVANSPNVGGGDAFEYVEIRNASDGPLAWDDFRVRYVRPLVDLTTVWATTWPSMTPDVVVEPGGVLVLWVRNEVNAGLDAGDFNAAYGSHLTEGVDLVMVSGEGLSNGALRGVELTSAFGVQLSRAYYNEDGNADAAVKGGVGVEYAPTSEPGGVQERVKTAAPSPGVVPSPHTAAPAIAQAPAGEEPVIIDDSGTTFAQGRGVNITTWIRDDGLVHSAWVDVWSDLDEEPTTYPLTRDESGTRTVHLAAADTLGRSAIHYRITATDGTHVVATETSTLTAATNDDALRIGGGHEGVPLGADLLVDPMPLNLTRREGDVVAGEVWVVTGGDAYPAEHTMEVAGTQVDARASLEHEPLFTFDATLTDPYFRNGVVMGDTILNVFDTGTYSDIVPVATSLPLANIVPGSPVTVTIVSGTKAAPAVDEAEANDDFIAMNARLVLPDGRVLRPRDYVEGERLAIGDGTRAMDTYDAVFDIPEDAFTALAYAWDTTSVPDGSHEVVATNPAGEVASVHLSVDNSAPQIIPTIEDGAWVRGTATLSADVTDSGSGVDTVSATLDGQSVRMPLDISSLTAAPGTHELAITATDQVGNTRTVTRTFAVPQESPEVTDAATVAGAQGSTLSAVVDDASGDILDVSFARGRSLELGTEVALAHGATTWSGEPDRAGAEVLSAEDVPRVATADDDAVPTPGDGALPYVMLTADVRGAEDDNVRVAWTGTAEADARVTLSLLDPATGEWHPFATHVTKEADEEITLEAVAPIAQWAHDGQVLGLVQHTEGYAGQDRSTRASAPSPRHPDDTPRDSYDFTLAWESDTQYYNAHEDIYDRQLSIHDYVLDARDDINLQYLIHTGDIVDWSEDEDQWLRADAAYSPLDDARLPYGVLAGNHDVDQATNDYGPYSQWFGDERFADNPWFGGSHLDNRGHYDLITAGGIDFLFLYMGWGAGDEQIEWMNAVLDEYPERIAVVSLHEYMLTTGGLGPLPQRIFDEVIAVQPTVRFVLSGHYHDAYTRLDSFDDDHDGVDDRTVTSMLFDYQDLPYGGQGYLRLLHFDNESESIQVRTYSDYLSDYTAVHPALDDINQEFTIPYAQAGIVVTDKVLETDAVAVDVLSDDVIASFDQVRALTPLEATWDGEGAWYVRATDPYGATALSDVVDPARGAAVLTASRD